MSTLLATSRTSLGLPLALFLAVGTVGCAGHSAKTLQARAALDANQPATARKLLNQQLKVKDNDEIPEKEKKDTALLVLDRSVISQSLEDYEASSSDLEYADKKVEMLDMSHTALDSIGKYLFSDDTGPYQGAPYEKVMINTMNMVNYLARRDLNGARIEARRMSIISDYLRNNKNPAEAVAAPGGYLAGFVFERSGRPDIALRYYDEALEFADFQSLVEPIARLSALTSYSTPRLRDFLERHGQTAVTAPAAQATPAAYSGEASSTGTATQAGSPESPSPSSQPAPSEGATTADAATADATSSPADAEVAQDGDLLVIVNYGRVPAKVAKRIPIGLALTYASLYMSPGNTATTNRLAAQGLVTWINYPELEDTNRRIDNPSLQVDGKQVLLEGAVALDMEARKAYEKDRGKIIAAAITRLIARVAVGEGAGAAARAASNEGWVGALVSLGTQAALTAADTPDTRSWSTLPARMAFGRMRLPAGQHSVSVRAQGVTKTAQFDMQSGSWRTIVLTILR